MSFKFTFREITSEDTEILRMLKLRNARPEDHICCEILRGDGITMKTWYSKADIALLGEDYDEMFISLLPRKVENSELKRILRDYFRIRSEKVRVEESITVYKDAAERFGDE